MMSPTQADVFALVELSHVETASGTVDGRGAKTCRACVATPFCMRNLNIDCCRPCLWRGGAALGENLQFTGALMVK